MLCFLWGFRYNLCMGGVKIQKDAQVVLRQYFGFDTLREGQDVVVEAVLAGKNVMAVMPTGGGKSLCYQLPALCREGLSLVVSPLIALMKDQVDALQEKGIPATMINSSLTSKELSERLKGIREGVYKLVYVAPERFGHEGFMRLLDGVKVSLFAVDEAHCVSQWGHDFRPDYLRLGSVIEKLGMPQVAAFTATATEQVRNDIIEQLRMKDVEVIVRGFARENLSFVITHCDKQLAKFRRLHALIQEHKTGIIYCSTRKKVEAISQDLAEQGIKVVGYHAGMMDAEREEAQNRFISGEVNVAVATNAFGMGIDRADLRFVVHFEIPGSVEAFYQEAGRAGRDGLPAQCELLFNHADLRTQEFFIEGANPPVNIVVDLYEMLRKFCDAETNEIHWGVAEMAEKLGLKNSMCIGSALSILMHARVIGRFDVPGQQIKGTRICDPSCSGLRISLDEASMRAKEERDRLKLNSMTRLAYSDACRQQWILEYFGESSSEACGRCDVCVSSKRVKQSMDPLEGAALEIVRKALSGVARASQCMEDGTWVGKFGRIKIMQMLRGAKVENLWSLARLSTYGILSNLSEESIKSLFQALSKGKLICTDGSDRPLLTLSPEGFEVMMGRAPAYVNTKGWMASAATSRRQDGVLLGACDEELFRALKELRLELSKDLGIPAHRIFTNATLEQLASAKPSTVEAALALKGIGPHNAARYLPCFLEVINEFNS